jgi:hypothetical protein
MRNLDRSALAIDIAAPFFISLAAWCLLPVGGLSFQVGFFCFSFFLFLLVVV